MRKKIIKFRRWIVDASKTSHSSVYGLLQEKADFRAEKISLQHDIEYMVDSEEYCNGPVGYEEAESVGIKWLLL